MKRLLRLTALIVLIQLLEQLPGGLEPVYLDKKALAGMDLREFDFSRGVLTEVDLRRADLRGASFRDAQFWEVDLRDANLHGADFRGAVYDEFTRWPGGFDPRRHGAKLDQ